VEIITVPSFALRQNSRSVNSEIGLALTSIPANCEIAGNDSSRKDRAASGGAREDPSQYLGFCMEPVLHGVAVHPSLLFVKIVRAKANLVFQ
jgi:hypothetical protein